MLRDVRLHVARGEVCGLLGPNGAGKTTTILAALGLLVPETGRVRLFGEDPLTAPDALRARLGLVPEGDGLTEWMTAGDYLQHWALLQGRPLGPEEAAALLDEVGLAPPPRLPAARFSQGMRRRLAVARALVASPELLILDEPTNGLDPRGRRQLLELLRGLARRRGVGVLLCTHLLEDVARICDTIAVLVEGRTVAEGALGELVGRAGSQRFRLRLDGPLPAEALARGSPLPMRVVHQAADEIAVELEPGATPATVWRTLLFSGWPICEARAEGGGLEAFYLALTEPGPVHPPQPAEAASQAANDAGPVS
ncbi:ABC transporter ATP-binding protein [Roseomonas sp. E05]|uniref:ABC transporter ATP-binding protein n=1 Tax=Roseomonas sp. E05 TaxID=3046310 RepID=UPI0024B8D478|nr:ABC transporter ATP-binding protein [Roseomonas sp. E05]MDJ0390299.1 ABC transporter ATP-binding protein [Roseomonas sp. E05]